MQCRARYFKKVFCYITSYFSQILTELHHYKRNTREINYCYFEKKKKSNMPNNLNAPILNVKLIKWSLNKINYYYKILYTNLHYLNVSVEQSDY